MKDVLRPILRPPPGRASAAVRRSLRAAFWLGLALVLLAGVVLPYLAPHWMPSVAFTTPSAEMEEGAYPPGTRLRDCRDAGCPWLVVVPAGEFVMGSPEGEEGHESDESPQHRVRIREPFAVMEGEVTRESFGRFVDETGYKVGEGCSVWSGKGWQNDAKRNWRDPGFEQRSDHPVVCVDWNGARAFAAWLSQRTGQTYRLLTEGEWEYAARAGSSGRYHFGDKSADLCRYANVADQRAKKVYPDITIADCDDGHVHTAPVKHYQPNGFGLYDMHGNAWEWVQDCWQDNYKGAPEDGSTPWETNCGEDVRVLRGGGWNNSPDNARSAIRSRYSPVIRFNFTGFRLARTLKSSSFTPLPPEQRSSK
ncbi:formylglycine-generating enzyme family protein [Zoogloea sp.]|uniref:formylglycine-generating enzyme family protein n=1 Tax=Zoogloea sp. TaxID=49181 RepID=UPI001ACA7794|nr:formylglycine-generating enzyme family protein [Zoogloea sp.]MBN8285568.1 formylglycine-generating enzyme family protein [Zoogloea sp.]